MSPPLLFKHPLFLHVNNFISEKLLIAHQLYPALTGIIEFTAFTVNIITYQYRQILCHSSGIFVTGFLNYLYQVAPFPRPRPCHAYFSRGFLLLFIRQLKHSEKFGEQDQV